MQVCLFTSTMPSARRKEAPVGQTSTQGGNSQCWHMTGNACVCPFCSSVTVSLRIHCASVLGRPWPQTPFSVKQASTQAVQPSAHWLASINSPQRCRLEAASSGERARASSIKCKPDPRVAAAAAAPARLRKSRRFRLMVLAPWKHCWKQAPDGDFLSDVRLGGGSGASFPRCTAKRGPSSWFGLHADDPGLLGDVFERVSQLA